MRSAARAGASMVVPAAGMMGAAAVEKVVAPRVRSAAAPAKSVLVRGVGGAEKGIKKPALPKVSLPPKPRVDASKLTGPVTPGIKAAVAKGANAKKFAGAQSRAAKSVLVRQKGKLDPGLSAAKKDIAVARKAAGAAKAKAAGNLKSAIAPVKSEAGKLSAAAKKAGAAQKAAVGKAAAPAKSVLVRGKAAAGADAKVLKGRAATNLKGAKGMAAKLSGRAAPAAKAAKRAAPALRWARMFR